MAAPVGSPYPDGEHWDEVEYLLPAGTVRVHAALWYQTMSREYAEFLRDENAGNVFDWNAWGERLYEAWETNGRSLPSLIDSVTILVADSVTAAPPGAAATPDGYRLDPAFPNPFNGTVTIPFAIPRGGRVVVTLTDAAGRVAATVADGRYPAGEHSVPFTAGTLPTGMYVVRMRAGDVSAVRKILLIR
jgi:hypothetical protein